jgi:hypothetical protein
VVEEVKTLKPKGDEKPNLAVLRTKANEIIEKYKVREYLFQHFNKK